MACPYLPLEKANNMAEIMEKIDEVLQEQVVPAARKLAATAAKIMGNLRARSAELVREMNKPPQAVAEAKVSTARAEQYMVSPVPAAHLDETVREVSQRLFSQAGAFEFIDLLFVTDSEQRMQGVVPLSKLLAVSPQTYIRELMVSEIASVALTDHPDRVAEVALDHQIPAVPVADETGHLLGAVPAHKVFKIMREEHIQDVDRMVGIWRHSEQALSAIEGDPVRRMVDRLPWLIVGTLGCVLATGLMATFENTLRADLAVAFFIPGIVYLADAIGTQSEAIAVRGLSFSRAPVSQLWRGELKTGFFLGIALAFVVFPFIWLTFSASLAFAVSVALICASSVATTIGLLLPSILSQLGKDPAYGSGPVATIIQDLLSLFIYLSVVSVLVF
jgi:magnesium transporter